MKTIVTSAKDKNVIGFASAGVAAYMLADIIHEVLGHAGTAFVMGYKITLLTSVYFKTQPGNVIISVAGPLANLLLALLIYSILRLKKDLTTLPRFLLLLVVAYNLFWFAGTILQSSLSPIGDWTYAIKELYIGAFGKLLLVVGGLAAYYFSIRLIRTQCITFNIDFTSFPLKEGIYYSYFTATGAAIIAGLFFLPHQVAAAREGLLEMIASLPILFILPAENVEFMMYKAESNDNLNIIIGILFIVFCLTLGKGFY